jgi:gliotoxin/aspirochlorine biosynthesis gamma-glutamylcyclotransferase
MALRMKGTNPSSEEKISKDGPGDKQLSDPRGDEEIWYFAYGSNMKSSCMEGRKITPLAQRNVQVRTHYVTFDIFGIPYSEPSYASIEEFPQGSKADLKLLWGSREIAVPSACGVAYLLTAADAHRLLLTEGSGVVYDLIKVEAVCLGSNGEPCGEKIAAYTLRSKHPLRPNGAPSARYMVSEAQRDSTHTILKCWMAFRVVAN